MSPTHRKNGERRKARTAAAWAVVFAVGYIDPSRISPSRMAALQMRQFTTERVARVKIEETLI